MQLRLSKHTQKKRNRAVKTAHLIYRLEFLRSGNAIISRIREFRATVLISSISSLCTRIVFLGILLSPDSFLLETKNLIFSKTINKTHQTST